MKYRVNVLLICLGMCAGAQASHCTVGSGVLSFGEYDSFYPGPLDAMTTISVQCDSVAPFRISMSPGLNSSGGVMQRQMQSTGSGEPLYYNLFLDAGHSQVWGDGAAGSDVFTSTGSMSETVPVFGRIPPAQRIRPGIYSDAVLITVEW